MLGKEIVASDLSCLTSNGWLTISMMREFVELFNKQSSETLVLVLNDFIGLGRIQITKLLAKEKGKHIKLMNIGRNDTETFVAKPEKQGCHWTIMYIDTTTNKWLYCDTLAWGPPSDLTINVNSLMNILIPKLSLPIKPVQGRFVAPFPDHNVSTSKIPTSTVKIVGQSNKRPIDQDYSGNASEDSKKPKLNITGTQEECLKIDVGSEFQSYAQLEKSIQEFQERNFVQLYKRSSGALMVMQRNVQIRR